MRQFLYIAALLLPLTTSANECFDSASLMLDVLKPTAERVGAVSLEHVSLSHGIYHVIEGQANDAYAEYSRGSIYLYAQFCEQPEGTRFQIIAHELGHAIDDAKGLLETRSMSSRIVPWEQRRSEISANQWMGKMFGAIAKDNRP